MPKFFVNAENISDSKAYIDGDNARHLKKVLRVSVGDLVTLCDGKGTDYNTVVAEIGENGIVCDITSVCSNENEPKTKISLFQGLPKGDKFSYIVEKCVEAGVFEITPVELKNCVVKSTKKDYEKKVDRLRKVSEAASKQSGRGIIPEIHSLVNLDELIKKKEEFDLLLFPYELAKDTTIKKPLKEFKGEKIAVIIGPEGGFSEKEANILIENGFVAVSLGKRILRTETAGAAAVFNIIYELEL